MIIYISYYNYLYFTFSDINECSFSNGDCQQTCINKVGNYHCGCYPGYELKANQVSCVGE